MKDLSTICGNCEKDEGLHSAFGLNCPLPNGEGFNSQSTFESKREPCPATPGWIAVSPSTMPEEDTAVLIAITNEAENHGTGEYERFPEVARGTIYGHPNGATADTDCGEFNDAEILGWQPLPVPPLAAPPAPHKEENGNSKL